MTDEIKNKEISPNFSVRIDIACADKKLAFTGEGDKETSELFFSVLKRLSQRMQKSEYLTELKTILITLNAENDFIDSLDKNINNRNKLLNNLDKANALSVTDKKKHKKIVIIQSLFEKK